MFIFLLKKVGDFCYQIEVQEKTQLNKKYYVDFSTVNFHTYYEH